MLGGKADLMLWIIIVAHDVFLKRKFNIVAIKVILLGIIIGKSEGNNYLNDVI